MIDNISYLHYALHKQQKLKIKSKVPCLLYSCTQLLLHLQLRQIEYVQWESDGTQGRAKHSESGYPTMTHQG